MFDLLSSQITFREDGIMNGEKSIFFNQVSIKVHSLYAANTGLGNCILNMYIRM